MGYIDRFGNWVIPPRYTKHPQFGEFSDGRAVVVAGDGYGIIDDVGRWIVRPGTYDLLAGYLEGMCVFRLKDEWGYLGLDGNPAIPARYKSAHVFSEGVALVEDEEGWHCIDRLGKTRFRLPGRPEGSVFRNGLLLVSESTLTGKKRGGMFEDSSDKLGYMSTSGEAVIPPQYDAANGFSEGLAVVVVWKPNDQGTPGKAGAVAERNEKETDAPSAEGKGPWGDEEDEGEDVYGAIDVTGRAVVPLAYQWLGSFHCGLAPFFRNGKFGYLARTGREVIPPRFRRAGGFHDGLAEVEIDGKVCLIDTSGRVAIQTAVEWVEF